MLNFNNTVADNTVVINGVTIGRLSDENAQKIISIIHAMENGNVEPKVSTTTTTTKPTKKSDINYADLGKIKDTVGYCTQYKNAIRYWENGFIPSNVKTAISKNLRESGAVWSKEIGAYVFKTTKEADAWMVSQRKYIEEHRK